MRTSQYTFSLISIQKGTQAEIDLQQSEQDLDNHLCHYSRL